MTVILWEVMHVFVFRISDSLHNTLNYMSHLSRILLLFITSTQPSVKSGSQSTHTLTHTSTNCVLTQRPLLTHTQ